ncbi:CDP-glycerol glycerophosphotransferase family protein [Glutamicibacter ardleyensis]|uniref:CDP-glycerol glycerophosphotransferase family protein n=1 Tax=Glutamicibacter ardleyensis TaxID=225894 RepID=UPI003FD3B50D
MNLISATRSITKFASKKIRNRRNQEAIASRPSIFSFSPQGDQKYRGALYFADGMVNAYQARQWFEPLRQLADRTPLVVIVRNAETAVQLQKECPLPIFYAKTIGDIEMLLEEQEIDAVFYVNQNIRNFQMMRFNRPAHIFISHGESEKAYMWSNQLKAYDYVFSAGEAARERLGKNLSGFDPVQRTRLIGRPQIDVNYESPVNLNPNLPTVLYAPTWEGDRPSMSYGSVSSHGKSLISSLVANGGYNVIFRPHPRSGINNIQYREDLLTIKKELLLANASSSATLVYDESPQWGWQWAVADICITDISAVAYDFLATGKPLMITTPVSQQATVDDSPALLRVPSLSTTEAQNAAAIVGSRLEAQDDSYADLVAHYFGDTQPGASMQRFITSSMEIIKGENHTDSTSVQEA